MAKPNTSQKLLKEKLVQIITNNPGASIGKIRTICYGGNPSRTDLIGILSELCVEERIEYIPINCYRIVS